MFGDLQIALSVVSIPLFLFDAAVGIAILQLRMICEHEKLLHLGLHLFRSFKADLSFLCLPLQLVVKLLSLLAQHWSRGVSFAGRLGMLGRLSSVLFCLLAASTAHTDCASTHSDCGTALAVTGAFTWQWGVSQGPRLAGRGVPGPSHSEGQWH